MNKTIRGKHSSLNLAYIAGFFDADGSVCITKWQNKKSGSWQHAVYVRVAGTKLDVIEHLNSTFSPQRKISISMYKTFKREKSFECYSWGCAGRNALEFLELIEPHLILKKKQAQLAIEFQNKKMSDGLDRRGIKLTEEDILWRDKYCERMKILNKPNSTK